MDTRKVRYHAALALIGLSGLASASLGQNAVGDGRALENSLRVPTPRITNSIQNSYMREMAFREAIMTGNAPSGLSFRGDTLPSRFEFRGTLGEDDLFAFRRDSMYSGLAGQGIRGTDALQYQFALTTGGRVPDTLTGQFSYARAGAAERGDNPDQPLMRDFSLGGQQALRSAPPDPDLLMPAVDTGTSLIQPVRSISSYTADRSMQPMLVGVMLNRTTQQAAGQTASPLLGVQMVPLDDLRNPMKFPDAPLTAPLSAPEAGTMSAAPDAAASTKPVKTAYDALMSRYREQAGIADPNAGGEGLPDWASQMTDLRRVLMGLPPSTAQAMGMQPAPEQTEPTSAVAGADQTGVGAKPAPEGTQTFDLELLRKIREAGGVTDTLIPTSVPNIDRYTVYMRSAEELLAKERYFDAEERFISAMSSRDGDVNAAVGRAHAELGGGLFLSAALNLRQIFIGHPEVTGMRYGPGLLPAPQRLEELVPMLREGVDSPTTGADTGLLLAYIGFQRQRPDEISQGLDALAKHGDESDNRMSEMLRGIWLDAGKQGVDDSAAPADGG